MPSMNRHCCGFRLWRMRQHQQPVSYEFHSICRLAKKTEDEHLLLYQIVSPDGKRVTTTPVPTSRGQMMHDFGITRRFAVFVEQALVFDLAPMFMSDTLPITLDTRAQCRCGCHALRCNLHAFVQHCVSSPCMSVTLAAQEACEVLYL